MNKDWFWKALSNALIGAVILLAFLLVVSKLPIPGNYKVLTVLSGSMEPAIHTGAVVVVKPVSEYKTGDIVTFANVGDKNVPVTHRLIEKVNEGGKTQFVTKGDANEDADGRKIGMGEIIGKVLFSIPFLGFVLEFLRQPLGFILVIALPAAVIIIDEALKIVKQLKS